MKSEKVKEIKKALECCQGESLKSCEHCPYWNWCKEDDGLTFKSDILTLINELEEENERLKDEVKVRKGFIEDYKIVCDKKDNENQQLKDRVTELEKENARLDKVTKHFQELIEDGKLISSEELKQFAERLKDEAFAVFMGEPIVRASTIDETLKEFVE